MKNAQRLEFNIMFRPEPEGGFTASIPSLPGCITYGKNLNEAKTMIVDAAEGYIQSMKKHKEKIVSNEDIFISSMQLIPSREKKA